MKYPILISFSIALSFIMLALCNAKLKEDTKAIAAQSCNENATCTGTKNCSVCKNCKYCKHCSKDGGICGVCK